MAYILGTGIIAAGASFLDLFFGGGAVTWLYKVFIGIPLACHDQPAPPLFLVPIKAHDTLHREKHMH